MSSLIVHVMRMVVIPVEDRNFVASDPYFQVTFPRVDKSAFSVAVCVNVQFTMLSKSLGYIIFQTYVNLVVKNYFTQNLILISYKFTEIA